jgi:long-chain acyl-CoA synthetase
MIPLLKLGGTVILQQNFDSRRLISTIASERVTCLRMVPTMMRMLSASSSFNAEELPSLRLLMNSSATIDPETYRAVKRRFPAVLLMNSYGLTEASTCTILPDSMALSDSDSIGQPIEGVEMCVRGEGGEMLGCDAAGEICVRGDHVFVGYYNRPEATRNASIDGWFRTGDLGHRNSRGLYYLHGRKHDLINCGGRKFAPAEVESCLLQLPEILEAAVIGSPHRTLGEVAKAFIVASERNIMDPKQVIRHCVRRLPSYKVPFSVEFVSELPKNNMGKLVRRKLQEV